MMGNIGRQWVKLYRKVYQVDFTDWMFFLPFNLMEEVNPNPEAPSLNT